MEYPDFKVCVRCFTYNHSKYITDALNGFTIQQTNFPFVCCIVDDASIDGEQDVIRKYVLEYFDFSEGSDHFCRETDYADIIYAQHKINSNCYFAVLLLKENHYSVRKSKMPYLSEWRDKCDYEALCEGDDYWIDSNKLFKQVMFLNNHNDYGMVYSKALHLHQSTGEMKFAWGGDCSYVEILCIANNIPTLTACYRLDLISAYSKSIINDPIWLMGDLPFWLYLLKYSKIKFLDTTTGVYRELIDSASHHKDLSKRINFLINSCYCRLYYSKKYWNGAYTQNIVMTTVNKISLECKLRNENSTESLYSLLLKNHIFALDSWINSIIASSTFFRKLYRIFAKMISYNKIQQISINDIKGVCYIVLVYIPSLLLRYRRKDIWLMCERMDSAQDNGWIFYKWIRISHPEVNAYFALSDTADHFDKKDKHFIAWGSLRHYMYYLASDVFVTSMFTKPRPNARVCFYYELLTHKRPKVMYIRHGICQHGLEEHLYKLLQVRMFVCGAKKEYDYFIEKSDYPEGYVQYTGFARYDDLLTGQFDGRYILIIPTWRRYLRNNNLPLEENITLFKQSNYYKTYISLLSSHELISFAEKENFQIKFCLHNEFRIYESCFSHLSDNIKFIGKDESIHDLLMGASIVITDFSSVFFDAAYMYKPVLYYHFDLSEYRQKHFTEGYFSYESDGFGPIIFNEPDLIGQLKEHYKNGKFEMTDKYKSRVDDFFTIRDANNCQRIYESIQRIIQ